MRSTARKAQPVPKDLRFFWKLFLSTFLLSAFTFGGGYVIVPLMRKRFVEQLGWIEEKEMLDITAIAQSSPGAMAVNASVLVGFRLAGVVGSLVTVLGTVLPPLITLTLVSLFYFKFRESEIVRKVLNGMMAGVVAVIVDVVIKMARDIVRQKEWLAILIMIAAFLVVRIFHVNLVYILLASGLVGAVSAFAGGQKGREAHKK
jgi:chromate transporter